LVALNMSSASKKVSFNLAEKGFGSAGLKSLVATPGASVKGMDVSLEPYGVFIGEVVR
jgi:hypothetical protein